MTSAAPEPTAPLPVVVVGGKSTRFGRDKLREPIDPAAPTTWLVDRPIAALRAVFGPRVARVGACHPSITARADTTIPDTYPGVGPIGGLVSVLEHPAGSSGVFVLAGDLACIDASTIHDILRRATQSPQAPAVLARTDRIEPLVGLYRPASLPALKARLTSTETTRLHDALPATSVVTVTVDPARLRNINTPTDL